MNLEEFAKALNETTGNFNARIDDRNFADGLDCVVIRFGTNSGSKTKVLGLIAASDWEVAYIDFEENEVIATCPDDWEREHNEKYLERLKANAGVEGGRDD